MQVQVTGKHVDVGEALRSRVSDEISTSIGKYFDREGGGADGDRRNRETTPHHDRFNGGHGARPDRISNNRVQECSARWIVRGISPARRQHRLDRPRKNQGERGRFRRNWGGLRKLRRTVTATCQGDGREK